MDGAGNNYKKVIRSRNGVKITLDDTDGQEKLILETPGGQKVTLKDGPGAVEIVGQQRQLGQARDERHHRHRVGEGDDQRQPGRGLGGMVTVDAGMSKFSGVVQADTVICNSVISASYTPGAGNIW